MTNQEPEHVTLRLPEQTFTRTVNKVVLAIMADDEKPAPAVAHYLVFNTDEFGCYKFKLTEAASSIAARPVRRTQRLR